MYQSFYRGSELLHLPLIAFCFFLAIFVSVLLWVGLAGKRRFEAQALLPLDDGSNQPTSTKDNRHG